MIVIEKLMLEEIPSILELYHDFLPFETSLDKSKEFYKEMVSHEHYYLAVAKEDGEILGSALGICCMSLTVSFLVIEDVIVKEGLRGKGIGRKLMEALDEFAQSNDCAYAILVSSGHRKEAHQFYNQVGYTEHVEGFRKIY